MGNWRAQSKHWPNKSCQRDRQRQETASFPVFLSSFLFTFPVSFEKHLLELDECFPMSVRREGGVFSCHLHCHHRYHPQGASSTVPVIVIVTVTITFTVSIPTIAIVVKRHIENIPTKPSTNNQWWSLINLPMPKFMTNLGFSDHVA